MTYACHGEHNQNNFGTQQSVPSSLVEAESIQQVKKVEFVEWSRSRNPQNLGFSPESELTLKFLTQLIYNYQQ